MIRVFALTTLLTLAACASAPIELQTPTGKVSCQNYTKALTIWDGSTSRPAGMSKHDADFACKERGLADQYKYERGQLRTGAL